jgi:hypothetical protein
MTNNTELTAPSLKAWTTFVAAWIERHGYNVPVTLTDLLTLPGAAALNPCGDRRALASRMVELASTIPGVRPRRIRKANLARNRKGAAGYYSIPALWLLERRQNYPALEPSASARDRRDGSTEVTEGMGTKMIDLNTKYPCPKCDKVELQIYDASCPSLLRCGACEFEWETRPPLEWPRNATWR